VINTLGSFMDIAKVVDSWYFRKQSIAMFIIQVFLG